MKMTKLVIATQSVEEQGVKTLAKFTITVGSHLSVEEVLTMFNQFTVSNAHISLCSDVIGDTDFEFLGLELDKVESVDEEMNE